VRSKLRQQLSLAHDIAAFDVYRLDHPDNGAADLGCAIGLDDATKR
jgi:hypothetical protein